MQNPQVKHRNRAIIIGAGASGLQIADLLQKSGFEIAILEAKDQIGGRIRQDTTFADFLIEIGGEEVHGETSIHHQIAEEVEAEFIDESELSYYVEHNNKLYKDDDLVLESPDFQRILRLDWDEIVAYDKEEDISLSDYVQANGFPKDLQHVIEGLICTEWAADRETISIKGIKRWNDAWCCGERNFLLKNISNYQIITKKFADVLNKIILKAPVTHVSYGEDKEVHVEDALGRTYKGDLVVISVPISQLKKNSITFEPQLPEKKVEAIQKLAMNPAFKVFLRFKNKFWKEDLGVLITKGVVTCMWPSSTGGKSDKAHVLTALITGRVAAKLSELKDDEVVRIVMEDLTRVYGKEVEKELESFIVQNWYKEEYIEGGYTFPHINEDENTRKILAEPVQNKVYFVGEAMSSKFSSISGALESSHMAFKEISKIYLEGKQDA